jgi:hypothetical protein
VELGYPQWLSKSKLLLKKYCMVVLIDINVCKITNIGMKMTYMLLFNKGIQVLKKIVLDRKLQQYTLAPPIIA